MSVNRLVDITYSKIFLENLHILKGDLEKLKHLIIQNREILTTQLDKVVFISDLADKIKMEKINTAIRQQEKYGLVLMDNFDEIKSLYDWLEKLSNNDGEVDTEKSIEDNIIKKDIVVNDGNSKIREISMLWTGKDVELDKLSTFLFTNKCIEDKESFSEVLLNSDYRQKVDWRQPKATLIHLISHLAHRELITNPKYVNRFIESNFLLNGEVIKNVKQSKNQLNNSSFLAKEINELLQSFKAT